MVLINNPRHAKVYYQLSNLLYIFLKMSLFIKIYGW